MEELVEIVAKKTAISEEQARKAIELVIQFIKQKLPPALGGTLDMFLKGDGLSDDILQGLSSLFEKK